MRILIAVLVCAMLTFDSTAQDNDSGDNVETLFDGEIESGGYGGFMIGSGPLYNGTGLFIGGQGAWIINHRIAIGGRGYALVNELQIKDLEEYRLDFGCGGGLFEYIIASDEVVHFKIHSMIGAGGVSYSKIEGENTQNGGNEIDPEFSSDGVFVFEPGVDVVLNVSGPFRIGLGATYRFVSDVDYEDLSNSDLNGVTGRLTLMFGSF